VILVDLEAGDPPPEPYRFALEDHVVTRSRQIIEMVRSKGDVALVELTSTLDGANISNGVDVPKQVWEQAAGRVPGALREALEAMAGRLRDLHSRQLPKAWSAVGPGYTHGEVVKPLASVGCYVPGGRAPYPSTVLMTVVPARIAGVPRVVVTSPPAEDGTVADAVLCAALVAGAHSLYRVGGAQAVAALALGTESIAPVAKIVGPGNVWVTAAKRELFGVVGIDGLSGPSELVVVADKTADPEVLAVDLVAQAEHDPLARTTLVALDRALVDPIERALSEEVVSSPRRAIVEVSIGETRAVLAPDEDSAANVVDRLAPEHLQIVTEDAGAFLHRVRSFGAAFLGPRSPVSFGDYGVGSNHVLPTMGTARFASGLRASEFVTVSSYVRADREGMERFGPEVESVARAEGLAGHARASEIRRTRRF
jgi:histidinol dehydrogenase